MQRAQALGIPGDVPVIGYVGTFVDYEGLDDLATACARLKAQGTNSACCWWAARTPAGPSAGRSPRPSPRLRLVGALPIG
jgi:glycosyltransferase involved in cell wall biosynthesis